MGIALVLVIFVSLLTTEVLSFPFRSSKSSGRTRIVYIAAVDIDWDYAPLGNIVNNDTIADNFITTGPNRIGSKYSKVVYREYTDESFLQQAPRPPWLGYLGPVFRAEVGDTILIKFANLAFKCNQPFTVHSHGVFYLKNAEGALYEDNTNGADKLDDGVPPGQRFTYEWIVRETFAPTKDDENCLPWAYHSHRLSAPDTDTGLAGLFLTCRRGTLDSLGRRRDVDKEFIIYQDVTMEQNSWCINSSINNCGDPAACASLLASEDADFASSNVMHHINGYVYGNLPGLVVGVGERVVFHFFALSEGIHGAFINGQVLTYKNHRLDTINFYPAYFRSALMIPEHPGTWLLASRIADWYDNGMQAYIHIQPRAQSSYRQPSHFNFFGHNFFSHPQSHSGHQGGYFSNFRNTPTVRRYYLAAEKAVWDYGPTGNDLYGGGLLTNENSTASRYFTQSDDRIGGKYLKARYIEYTDSTFTQRKVRTPDQVHLGVLGPAIRVEVGETFEVVFRNNADRDFSFYPHGITFPKEQEGFVTKDPTTNQLTGKVAKPGETITYRFTVTERASPTEDDPQCLTYMYQSAVDPVRDIYTGLIGPLIICKRGHKFDWSSEGLPSHWDTHGSVKKRVFYLLFMTMNENKSWYIDENINMFALNASSVDKTDAGFELSNEMFSINGLTFGNLPGLDMCVGDHVTWHIFGLGNTLDNHGVNFHGQTLEFNGNHVEGKVINPGLGITFHSIPDVVGRWAVHCRTNFHFDNGMKALYDVFSCGAHHQQKWGHGHRHVRRYYIQAQEVLWDYAPIRIDLITGLPLTNTSLPGYRFVRDDPDFIGAVYKKAIYRQYTDGTFTTEMQRGPEDTHLEILGPIIRAEVGEIIQVHFKNNASRPFSIHPQGLLYNKANEGAQYQDGSSFTGDNSVAPGSTYIYTWEVPERSGPAKNDPNCISWIYHSSVDSVADIYSGLIGPLIICRRGTLNAYGKRTDKIDREFVLLFLTMNENSSNYFGENTAMFAPNRTSEFDPEFFFANLKFSVNGRIYGNVRSLTMQEGETVAWHIQGLGSSQDIHPIHFHGQTFIHRTDKRHRKDVIEVFPSTTQTVEMFTDNPGTWLVHCHLSVHVSSGMEAVYTIIPKGGSRHGTTTHDHFFNHFSDLHDHFGK